MYVAAQAGVFVSKGPLCIGSSRYRTAPTLAPAGIAQILRVAQRHKGLILFEDEASFAQWGSLSYTWARRGQQPEVKTSGKRKGYKVFGAIEYGFGRLFYQGIEGRFNSETYQGFLQMIMEQTTQPLFLIHDGARYHASAATQAFLAAHRDRIAVEPLPSYSPDYNPIEYLWKKTKKRATHNQYFKEFAALTMSVGFGPVASCYASRHRIRAFWGLLRRKRLGTATGCLNFQKQT